VARVGHLDAPVFPIARDHGRPRSLPFFSLPAPRVVPVVRTTGVRKKSAEVPAPFMPDLDATWSDPRDSAIDNAGRHSTETHQIYELYFGV